VANQVSLSEVAKQKIYHAHLMLHATVTYCTYKALNGLAPVHLTDLLLPYTLKKKKKKGTKAVTGVVYFYTFVPFRY